MRRGTTQNIYKGSAEIHETEEAEKRREEDYLSAVGAPVSRALAHRFSSV